VIRQAAILFGVPVVIAVLVAVPLAQWRGSYQWLCAAVALGLTVPVGLATLLLANWMSKASAYGQIAAMFVGTAVRMVIGFGGAVVVFVAAGDTFRGEPLVFFGWVLGAYLVNLTVEIALLGSQNLNAKKQTSGS
jgi:spore maturation protein SpmB